MDTDFPQVLGFEKLDYVLTNTINGKTVWHHETTNGITLEISNASGATIQVQFPTAFTNFWNQATNDLIIVPAPHKPSWLDEPVTRFEFIPVLLVLVMLIIGQYSSMARKA